MFQAVRLAVDEGQSIKPPLPYVVGDDTLPQRLPEFGAHRELLISRLAHSTYSASLKGFGMTSSNASSFATSRGKSRSVSRNDWKTF